MATSSDIRRDNKKIYKLMLNYKSYTKQQISVMMRLSVATCKTLLKDIKSNGNIIKKDHV